MLSVAVALTAVAAAPAVAGPKGDLVRRQFGPSVMADLPVWPPVTLSSLIVSACREERDAASCYYVALFVLEKIIPEASAAGIPALNPGTLERLCGAKDTLACLALGSAHLHGLVAAKDPAASRAAYVKACGFGDATGCHFAEDQPRACELGFAVDCLDAAKAALKADSSPIGQAKAVGLDVKGCKYGSGLACLLVGAAYLEGSGVTRSEAMASKFLERACSLGNKQGCNLISGGDKVAAEVRAKWKDAVVEIRVLVGSQESRGTGFFISSDGVLVTNYHVMEPLMKAKRGQATFVLSDGRQLKSFDVGDCHESDMRDLCLLRISVEPKVHFSIGNTSPPEKTPVYLIGFSSGLWLTRSATFLGDFAYANAGYVEITHVTRPGDSGGPIFTREGVVVGITTYEFFAYHPPGGHETAEDGAQSIAMAAREVTKLRSGISQWIPSPEYLSR